MFIQFSGIKCKIDHWETLEMEDKLDVSQQKVELKC